MSTHGFKIDDTSDKDWIIVHDVPVLDEHRLHIPADKDGKQAARVVDVNRDLLMRLAANNNRNIRETGDWVPLTEGHTTDDGPESSQPEILGYADDFKVGQLFNTERLALLARFRISKDPEKLKKAKNLPRRSVELWLDREEINPISLLGSTAPERNLGLLRLQRMFQVGQLLRHKDTYRDATGKLRFRATRQTLRFSHELGEMMTPTPGMSPVPGNPVISQETIPGTAPAQQDPAQVQALMAAVQQTDTWQQMTQTVAQMQQMMQQMQPLMQMMGGMGQPGTGQPGMGGGGMGAGMGQPDPMQALIAQLAGGQGGGNPDEQTQEEEPVQMQAGGAGGGQMGLPGAGSAFLPGMIQSPQTTSDRTVLPRISMSHAQHMRNGETLESAVVRLAAERDEAVRVGRKATVINELLALQTQDGIILDVNEELPELVDLDDNARAVRYNRMRVRYSKRTTPLQQQQQAIPEKPQLPTLIPAVGVNTPTGAEQIQKPAGAANERMTKEERDMALDIIEQARVVHTRQSPGQPWTPPTIADVLRLMRQGNVVRLQRNGVPEHVY